MIYLVNVPLSFFGLFFLPLVLILLVSQNFALSVYADSSRLDEAPEKRFLALQAAALVVGSINVSFADLGEVVDNLREAPAALRVFPLLVHALTVLSLFRRLFRI